MPSIYKSFRGEKTFVIITIKCYVTQISHEPFLSSYVPELLALVGGGADQDKISMLSSILGSHLLACKFLFILIMKESLTHVPLRPVSIRTHQVIREFAVFLRPTHTCFPESPEH